MFLSAFATRLLLLPEAAMSIWRTKESIMIRQRDGSDRPPPHPAIGTSLIAGAMIGTALATLAASAMMLGAGAAAIRVASGRGGS
jgi:hypothetical protein